MLTDDLLELQRIDTSLDQLRHRRAHLSERDHAAAAAGGLSTADRRRAAIVARNDELELDIEALEEDGVRLRQQRERLEGQLRTVTTTRQADAISHELDALSGHRDEMDDRELAALDEQATLAAELAELDGALPALASAADEAAAALAAAEGAIDSEAAALSTARSELTGRLESGVMERYEGLRSRFGGVAVARLEGTRCSGCHLDLSTVELEEVRATPQGEFANCPQCGRLLVP